MKMIFNSFMTDGTRPNRYCRGYELVKNTNRGSSCGKLGYPMSAFTLSGLKLTILRSHFKFRSV